MVEAEGEVGFAADVEDDLNGFGWGENRCRSGEGRFEEVVTGFGSVVLENTYCSRYSGYGFG